MMTKEEMHTHEQLMLDHLKKRQQLLFSLSDLLDRLDQHQIVMPAHHRLREEGRLLVEATDMLHRLVEEVIPYASEI